MPFEQARQRTRSKLAHGIAVAEVVRGLLDAQRLAQRDDLRPGVRDRLEQHRPHVHVRIFPACQRLQDLRARHLEPARRDARLVGHVLRLEGRHVEARLRKQTTKPDGDQALAHVRSRTKD